MIFTTSDALRSLAPTAIWRVENPANGPETVVWTEGTRPSEAAIAAEITRLQDDYDSKEYERLRVREYPPIEDYIDGVVKNDQEQIDAYIAACQAVKLKYPKPE